MHPAQYLVTSESIIGGISGRRVGKRQSRDPRRDMGLDQPPDARIAETSSDKPALSAP